MMIKKLIFGMLILCLSVGMVLAMGEPAAAPENPEKEEYLLLDEDSRDQEFKVPDDYEGELPPEDYYDENALELEVPSLEGILGEPSAEASVEAVEKLPRRPSARLLRIHQRFFKQFQR